MSADVQRRIGDETMRKIVAILMSCLMLASAAVFSVQAAVTDVSGTQFEEAVELLSRLGIAEVEEEYYYPAKSITKAEFLVMAMRIIGFRDNMISNEAEQLFYDVEPGAYGAGYIAAAYHQGIIFGNGDGFFGAERNVTLNEGLSILLRAMNYDVMADENGGYPAGYVSTARRLDLLKGVQVDSTGYLSRGTAAQLVYNALKTKPMLGTVLKGERQYSASGEENLLEAVFGVYIAEGVVDGNRFVSLPDGGGVRDGQITIEQEPYDIEDEYEGKYLGYHVKAYYTKQNNVRKILYMNAENNTVQQINVREAVSYIPGKFTYYTEDGNRKKDIRLSPYAVTVWNNNVVKVGDEGLKIPDYGQFVLVDNDGDGQIDVVHITAFDVMVLSAVDASTKMLYNKKNTSKNINLADYDRYYLYDQDGTPIELSALGAEDILEICAGTDKKAIEIYRVHQQAEFAVKSITGQNDDVYVSDEDGNQYRLSKAFYGYHSKDELKLSNTYRFALNREGDIVTVLTTDGTALTYGYMTKCTLKDNVFSKELLLKVFTMDEEFTELHSDGKIRLYSSGKMLEPEKIASELTKPQVIRYALNTEGKLKTIDLPSDDMFSTGFRRMGSVPAGSNTKENRYKAGSKTIGGQILIGSGTRAIITPDETNLDDEDGYAVSSSAYFDDDEYYPGGIAYSSNPNSVAAELVVIPGRQSTVGSSSPYMLVTGFGRTLDSDKMDTQSLNGYVSGKEATYAVADGVELSFTPKGDTIPIPVEEGDVVQFAMNNRGEITKVNILYDQSLKEVYGASGGADVSVAVADQSRHTLSTPMKIVDNCLFVQYDGYATMSSDIFVMSNAYVYEFDSTKEGKRRFSNITYRDIVTKEDNADMNDKIFISQRYSEPKIAVVYK